MGDWWCYTCTRSNIISRRPKVGKTRLAIALIKSVLLKQQFLDYTAPTEDRKVIFITDDQSDSDSFQMLDDAGIYHHPTFDLVEKI